MKILPVMFNNLNVSRTFGQKFDLGDELNRAINKKLHNDDSDSFVPSTPSQPVIIEKLEINQQNDKDSSAKKGNGSGFLTGTGTGFVGSEVTDKIIDSKNNNHQEDIDVDKMIDETATENNAPNNDMSIEEMMENEEFIIDESNDIDSDFDMGDIDE